MTGLTVLLAGGGSGGHISPGLAIAEALRRADPSITCLFASSDRRIDADMLNVAGEQAIPLPARPPSLRPANLWSFLKGMQASDRIVSQVLHQKRVDAVVLLGGFVAAPVARAAKRAGVPTLLVNLDRVPGRANRWMRPRVNGVVSAVTTVAPFAEAVTGMPVRAAAAPPGDPAYCREILGLPKNDPVLVITGASQGATTINTILPALFRDHPRLAARWQILHLSGPSNAAPVRLAWEGNEHQVTVLEFCHHMGAIWGAADLVVSRAGACSVAEIEHAGVPAVYLPYPHHRDQHQRRNAEPAVEAGAAWLVEDSADRAATAKHLLSVLGPLLEDPPTLVSGKEAAQARSGRNAAESLAAMTLSLARTT